MDATLAGAVIGLVGVMSASFAERYIVGPVITKVTECFPEKAPVNHFHITISY